MCARHRRTSGRAPATSSVRCGGLTFAQATTSPSHGGPVHAATVFVSVLAGTRRDRFMFINLCTAKSSSTRQRLYRAHGAVLALAILCGCAEEPGSDAEWAGAEVADTYEDAEGRSWVAVGPAVFDLRDEATLREKAIADRVADIKEPPPNPAQYTDEEWGKIYEPISEFGGKEYRLTDASRREYGKTLRAAALNHAANPAADRGRPAMRPAGEALAPEPAQLELLQASRPGAEAKGLVGADDRFSINHLRSTWPYKMHGAMSTNNTGSGGLCTAFKVTNQDTAGTAAHCVHTGSGWAPRMFITFSDGGSGTVDKNCYARTISNEWLSHPNLPKNDYAVLTLRGRHGAVCNRNQYAFGWYGDQGVGYTTSVLGHVSGYPAPGLLPPGVTSGWPTLVYHQRGDAEVKALQPQVFKYYNDTAPGQSGTAFISFHGGSDYRVRAIHRGEVEWWNVDHNEGREFESNVREFFNANSGS
jgi:V8-like Glu-specific endopeptidase